MRGARRGPGACAPNIYRPGPAALSTAVDMAAKEARVRWEDLPQGIWDAVAALLGPRALADARLACREWASRAAAAVSAVGAGGAGYELGLPERWSERFTNVTAVRGLCEKSLGELCAAAATGDAVASGVRLVEVWALLDYRDRPVESRPHPPRLVSLWPLLALQRLESLRLDGGFRDAEALAALPALRALRIRPGGSVPDRALSRLARLTSLEVLDYRGQDLGALTGLQSLAATGSDSAPSPRLQAAGLRALRELTLERIGGGFMEVLLACAGLRKVDLFMCPEGFRCLDALPGLPQLEELSLESVPRDADLQPLAAAPKLRVLTLYNSFYFRYAPQIHDDEDDDSDGLEEYTEVTSFAPLAAARSLRALHLYDCDVSESGLGVMAGLSQLERLTVSGCTEDLPPASVAALRARGVEVSV